MWGNGIVDAIDIQRQFNEFEAHIARQIRLSGSEDPFERVRQIAAAQQALRAKTDELLEAYVEQEKQ